MKSVSHSEARWALLPEHVIRCNGHMVNGRRCRREAEAGSLVCRLHGGAAPQVRRRAGERLVMNADHASQKLLEWLDDPEVPYRVRAEIARDMLDRAGLAAAQLHKIVPMDADPVLTFFEGLFSDPNNWVENPPPDATPAIESYAPSTLDHHDAEPDETVEAEIVEPDGEPANDTPPRVAEMIKSGAFNRKPGE
jgi:hypothetical protein